VIKNYQCYTLHIVISLSKEGYMSTLNSIVLTVQHYLSDYILIVMLLGGGIWFTLRLHFIQVRGFGRGMHSMFSGLFSKKGKADDSGMSSFQALATAIAAQVGTGNIAGAATALAIGGPGAIFWMWLAAFLGMATIFGEATMAQKFKTTGKDGAVTGGPVYYIRAAFTGKFGKVLAGIFAVLITLALGFMGNAVQSNSIAVAFHTAFNVPQWIVGLLTAAVALFVFVGGISRIASVTEKIVPFMALLYIIGSLIVIIYNWRNIPYAFKSIFVGAFDPSAVVGGAAGATLRLALTKGVARGLFSNEAGMGSTPHAHAIAKVDHPVQQGFVAIVGVFIDTFVILTMTALVIITTKAIPSGKTGVELTQYAYSTLFGKGGNIFIAVSMFFFAFSTVLGWYFFGQTNVKYLFGPKAVKPYACLVAVCVFLGSLAQVDLVWNMADCFNSMMVIPNILALFALTGTIKKVHDDYFNHYLPQHPDYKLQKKLEKEREKSEQKKSA
jgi:amino acid carrier protein